MRLLRVIEERCYEPLGSSRSVKADVRIIAASNKNLAHLVEEDLFRKDLFYRINVVKIEIPPLSQRKEDIPLLAEHFINRLNKLRDRSVMGLSHEALSALMSHDWPGNIRELENAIEYAFIMCRQGLIRPEHLPEHLYRQGDGVPLPGVTLEEIERRAVWEALERNSWRRMATARELGIDKNTLRRKIKRHCLEEPDSAADTAQ